MTAKHTPGPWIIHRGQYHLTIRKEFNPAHFTEICGAVQGYMYSADEKGEQEANAHLIAAAPDLLAACEFALTTPGMIKGRDAMMKAVAAARGTDASLSTTAEG